MYNVVISKVVPVLDGVMFGKGTSHKSQKSMPHLKTFFLEYYILHHHEKSVYIWHSDRHRFVRPRRQCIVAFQRHPFKFRRDTTPADPPNAGRPAAARKTTFESVYANYSIPGFTGVL